MDISTYRKLVVEYNSSKLDLDGLEEAVKVATGELESMKAEFTDKLNSITQNKEDYISNLMRVKIVSLTQPLKSERQSLMEKRDELENEKFSFDYTSARDFYQDYYDLLIEAKKVVTELKEQSSSYINIVPLKKSNIKDLSLDSTYDKIQGMLKKIYLAKEGTTKEEKRTLIDTLVNFITVLPQDKRLAYVLLIVGLTATVTIFSPGLVATILITSMLMYNSFVENKIHTVLSGVSDINELIFCIVSMDKILKDRIEASKDKQQKAYNESKDKQIKDICKSINQLSEDISQSESKITKEVEQESKKTNFEDNQRTDLTNLYSDKIKDLEERLSDKQTMLEEVKSTNEDLYNKIVTGKQELEDQYFNLKSCGTEKILPENFLLGFDNFNPITLDMVNYNANIITTVNRSEQVIASFITMCITQLFCAMNPSCLKIHIVDIENGTGRFGLYGSLENKGIVNIVKTKDELKNTIKYLYELKSERDCTIITKQDHINKYNQAMIDNFGLTLPYHILILTHQIDDIIYDKYYRQIIQGGNIGISVIAVWNKSLFDATSGESVEKLRDKADFLKYICETANGSEEGNTNLSSISLDGVIMPLQRQEVDTKRRNIMMAMKNKK